MNLLSDFPLCLHPCPATTGKFSPKTHNSGAGIERSWKLNNVCRRCDDTKYFMRAYRAPEARSKRGLGWKRTNPHKTTKQLSSTNLIFSHRNKHETISLLSHLLDLLPSLDKHEPQTTSSKCRAAPFEAARFVFHPTIYNVANGLKTFPCHNKLFICNIVCSARVEWAGRVRERDENQGCWGVFEGGKSHHQKFINVAF